jgi:glycosyltransferase involved in cell wall biosynthesis
MPSFEEPFGLVFAEAMAMGKPVVALASGGALEVVADGETGLLSPPGDAGALADNISRLLADPALRESMGRAGRERVERLFRSERLCEDYAAFYHSLAAAGAASA